MVFRRLTLVAMRSERAFELVGACVGHHDDRTALRQRRVRFAGLVGRGSGTEVDAFKISLANRSRNASEETSQHRDDTQRVPVSRDGRS